MEDVDFADAVLHNVEFRSLNLDRVSVLRLKLSFTGTPKAPCHL
jgi:hypothetical protein